MSAIAEQLATRPRVGSRSKRLNRVLVFWVPLVLFIVITLFPFYWMLLASLKANTELYNLRAFPFIVANFTLDHYTYLFERTLYATWLKNTLIVSIVSTAIAAPTMPRMIAITS